MIALQRSIANYRSHTRGVIRRQRRLWRSVRFLSDLAHFLVKLNPFFRRGGTGGPGGTGTAGSDGRAGRDGSSKAFPDGGNGQSGEHGRQGGYGGPGGIGGAGGRGGNGGNIIINASDPSLLLYIAASSSSGSGGEAGDAGSGGRGGAGGRGGRFVSRVTSLFNTPSTFLTFFLVAQSAEAKGAALSAGRSANWSTKGSLTARTFTENMCGGAKEEKVCGAKMEATALLAQVDRQGSLATQASPVNLEQFNLGLLIIWCVNHFLFDDSTSSSHLGVQRRVLVASNQLFSLQLAEIQSVQYLPNGFGGNPAPCVVLTNLMLRNTGSLPLHVSNGCVALSVRRDQDMNILDEESNISTVVTPTGTHEPQQVAVLKDPLILRVQPLVGQFSLRLYTYCTIRGVPQAAACVGFQVTIFVQPQ
jgi:hypothetical protein